MQTQTTILFLQKISCLVIVAAVCNIPAFAVPQASQDKPASQDKKDDGKKPVSLGNSGAFYVLSDTEGVDFGPYMRRMQATVQQHWDPLVPKSAYFPIRKSGKVTIKFAVMKDGWVRGVGLVQSSGNVDLDRAAWGAIVSSSPFPALPAAYTKESLLLQLNFFYNPAADEKAKSNPQQPDTKK